MVSNTQFIARGGLTIFNKGPICADPVNLKTQVLPDGMVIVILGVRLILKIFTPF